MDSFEREHYTKLLKEVQLLSKHKAEKERKRTLKSIPLIDLENSQEIYPLQNQAKNCLKSGWIIDLDDFNGYSKFIHFCFKLFSKLTPVKN